MAQRDTPVFGAIHARYSIINQGPTEIVVEQDIDRCQHCMSDFVEKIEEQ